MRLSNEEIHKIMEKNDCKYTLSWSKLNTFVEAPYSFYLKYVHNPRIPEEKRNSYAFLGDVVHSGLEAFYAGTKDIDTIIDDFETKIMEQRLSDMNFVKDEDKNSKIEQNYYSCIKHFLKNYKRKSKNSKLEVFVGYKFNDYFMQGYIDHMYPLIDENNYQYVVIEDFKTSTLYSGAKIEQNSGQLKLYAYMIHKNYNIPIDSIKIGWNFLKYVGVDIEQKNGKVKESKILRNELPDKLFQKMKTWAKHFKYSDDDIVKFYDIMKNNNEEFKDVNIFDGIPTEIAEKFNMHDCFVEIPFDEQVLTNFIQYVSDTIEDMSNKINLYKVTKDDKIFWSNIDASNSFYYLNLCGYTSKHHLPLREYLNKISSFEGTPNKQIDDDVMEFLFKNT